MKSRGFTLLEMVVTVLIFGIVGVLAVQLLAQSVRTAEKVISRSAVLGEWHRGMSILEQDFLQLSPRSIRDEFGDGQPNIVLGSPAEIEFTRSGWPNVLNRQRSDLQRVAYFLQENGLYRRYWNVLDRAKDTQAVDQLMLQNVHSVEFEVIDGSGREHYFWPPSSGLDAEYVTRRLVAVRMTLDMAALGTVSHLWIVPSQIALRLEQLEPAT